MSDDSYQIAMAARLDPQDTKAVLAIMEGDALNQTREDLAVWSVSFLVHGRLRPDLATFSVSLLLANPMASRLFQALCRRAFCSRVSRIDDTRPPRQAS